jgi:glutathione S-transferase
VRASTSPSRSTARAGRRSFVATDSSCFRTWTFERIDLEHAKAQLRACAGFVDEQLADGRPFLAGSSPGLLDIHAWTIPWFARAHMPVVNELLADLSRLPAWEARVERSGRHARRRQRRSGIPGGDE